MKSDILDILVQLDAGLFAGPATVLVELLKHDIDLFRGWNELLVADVFFVISNIRRDACKTAVAQTAIVQPGFVLFAR